MAVEALEGFAKKRLGKRQEVRDEKHVKVESPPPEGWGWVLMSALSQSNLRYIEDTI
ncbi:MAG: hypothetical protein ABR974_10155 [Bacteroidales bacterium]